ncbi:MAG: hypothetical protein ACXACI_04665 [Candidatus Hodarchaeales archaeon]
MMSFPCPHCGSESSYEDRTVKDFKPIIPKELQEDFSEPPLPIASPNSVATPISESPPTSREAESLPRKQPESAVTTHLPSISTSPEESMKSKSPATTPIEKPLTSDERLDRIETTLKSLEKDVRTILRVQKVIEIFLKNFGENEKRKAKAARKENPSPQHSLAGSLEGIDKSS